MQMQSALIPQPSSAEASQEHLESEVSRTSSVRTLSQSPPSRETSLSHEEEEGFVAGMMGRYQASDEEASDEEDNEEIALSRGAGSSYEDDDEDSDEENGPLSKLRYELDRCGAGGLAGGGCGCCCCLLVFMLIMYSIAGIEATHFGLKRNAMTSVVDYSNVYMGGRHFIGFYNNFVEFPGTIQTVEWNAGIPATSSTRDEAPMQMRTQEGIMVDLSMAVQYQIVRESVAGMYADFKLAVEQNFVSMLRAGFSDLVQMYPTSDLWEQRQEMQRLLLEKCQEICLHPVQGMKGYLTCWNLQLHGVGIPENVEHSVIQKQVQEQNAALETNRQRAALTRAATTVMAAQYNRDIAVVQSRALAGAFALTQAAESEQLLLWRSARASAVVASQQELSQLDHPQLVRYFELKAIIDGTNASMAYGDFSVAWL